MAWQKGPLQKNTWGWGAVVAVGEEDSGGFGFADFCGDHALVIGSGADRKLKAYEVAYFDNSMELPPTGCGSRTGAR